MTVRSSEGQPVETPLRARMTKTALLTSRSDHCAGGCKACRGLWSHEAASTASCPDCVHCAGWPNSRRENFNISPMINSHSAAKFHSTATAAGGVFLHDGLASHELPCQFL